MKQGTLAMLGGLHQKFQGGLTARSISSTTLYAVYNN